MVDISWRNAQSACWDTAEVHITSAPQLQIIQQIVVDSANYNVMLTQRCKGHWEIYLLLVYSSSYPEQVRSTWEIKNMVWCYHSCIPASGSWRQCYRSALRISETSLSQYPFGSSGDWWEPVREHFYHQIEFWQAVISCYWLHGDSVSARQNNILIWPLERQVR